MASAFFQPGIEPPVPCAPPPLLQYVASRAAATAVDLDVTSYSKTKQVANPWWGARFRAANESALDVTAGGPLAAYSCCGNPRHW